MTGIARINRAHAHFIRDLVIGDNTAGEALDFVRDEEDEADLWFASLVERSRIMGDWIDSRRMEWRSSDSRLLSDSLGEVMEAIFQSGFGLQSSFLWTPKRAYSPLGVFLKGYQKQLNFLKVKQKRRVSRNERRIDCYGNAIM